MKTMLLALIFSLLVILPAAARAEKTAPAKITDSPSRPGDGQGKRGKPVLRSFSPYKIISLEDFEKNTYSAASVTFQRGSAEELVVRVISETPAPNGTSKKYLSIKFRGKKGDVLVLKPASELAIDRHCREFSLWVLGRQFPGEISLVVADTAGREHRLVLGSVNFTGWRKMKLRPGQKVLQRDEVLNQKKPLKILSIQYRPDSINPELHQLYIDDLSADLRDRYLDIQKNEW